MIVGQTDDGTSRVQLIGHGYPVDPQVIDITLLAPDATADDIARLCAEAVQYNCFGVCVNSSWVRHAKVCLGKESTVKVVAVVGFPLGAMSSSAKEEETRLAVDDGADEIDMVINIGRVKMEDTEFLMNDIGGVVVAAGGRPVKVIVETAFLDVMEISYGCVIAKDAGAAFVKTCTGFGGGGATVEHVTLMANEVRRSIGVKASGGIRTAAQANALVAAGATRLGIGEKSAIAILTGQAPGDSAAY